MEMTKQFYSWKEKQALQPAVTHYKQELLDNALSLFNFVCYSTVRNN